MKWKTNYKGFPCRENNMKENRGMEVGEEYMGEEKLNLVQAPGINAP